MTLPLIEQWLRIMTEEEPGLDSVCLRKAIPFEDWDYNNGIYYNTALDNMLHILRQRLGVRPTGSDDGSHFGQRFLRADVEQALKMYNFIFGPPKPENPLASVTSSTEPSQY